MDYSSVIGVIKPSIALVFEVIKDAQLSKGTGFIYQEKGILVTCNHVISRRGAILLRFPDTAEDAYVSATVLIRDEEHDLAILKFNEPSRKPLEPGDVRSIKAGTPVIFSGYPLSLNDLTTHQGIISAIIKDASGITNYLIDGTVNQGNSGCPLMTTDGKVIGVVNAKRREQSNLLQQVEDMRVGAISLHGVDLVEIYQALIDNVQLGIGYAIPASYIPKHRTNNNDIKPPKENETIK